MDCSDDRLLQALQQELTSDESQQSFHVDEQPSTDRLSPELTLLPDEVLRKGRPTKEEKAARLEAARVAGLAVTPHADGPGTSKGTSKTRKPKSPRTPKSKGAGGGQVGVSKTKKPSVKPRKPEKRHLVRWDSKF